MKIEENEVYTTKELAEILKVSLPTIKRMLKEKKLPSTRIGRQHRFLGSDILEIMSGGRKARETEQLAEGEELRQPAQRPGPPPVMVEKTPPGSGKPASVIIQQRTPPHPRFGPQEIILTVAPPPAAAEAPEPVVSPPPWDEAAEIPPAVTGVPLAPQPPMSETLHTAILRQKAYLVGKQLLRDVFDEDGHMLFEQGCVVTERMVETAQRKKKFMELYSAVQHEE